MDFNGSFSAFEESVGFSVVEYKSSKWEEAQEMLLTEEKKLYGFYSVESDPFFSVIARNNKSNN